MAKSEMLLKDKKITIIADGEYQSEVRKYLTYQGADVVELSSIRIEVLSNYNDLDQALSQIILYKYLVFTSSISVDYFIARLLGSNMKIEDLKHMEIYTSGIDIAKRIVNFGLNVSFVGSEYDPKIMIAALQEKIREKEQVLVISGKIKNMILSVNLLSNTISLELRQLGIKVNHVIAFGVGFADVKETDIRELLNKTDLIIFTTFFSIKFFHDLWMKQSHFSFPGKIATFGPFLAKAANEKNIKIDIIPRKAEVEDLVNAIIEYYTMR